MGEMQQSKRKERARKALAVQQITTFGKTFNIQNQSVTISPYP